MADGELASKDFHLVYHLYQRKRNFPPSTGGGYCCFPARLADGVANVVHCGLYTFQGAQRALRTALPPLGRQANRSVDRRSLATRLHAKPF